MVNSKINQEQSLIVLERKLSLCALEKELTALTRMPEGEINLFEILKIDKEAQLSTLLAHLFNWGNKVSVGDRFLNDFIMLTLGRPFMVGSDYDVSVEVHVTDEARVKARRPDIVIESDEKVICVENKIHPSASRQRQIQETVNYIINKKDWLEKRKAYLYLAPRTDKQWLLDETEETSARYGKQCVVKQVYWSSLVGLLDKYLRIVPRDTRLHFVLSDLLITIEKEIDNDNQR
ncbi:MAG TPA: hypothetical protein DDW31_01825 [candidate division Zixibacteria bacterium]|jgi:hypothetical protein|nr:hypothetical protein [candidate division Zixibacteria bacterium]